MAMEKGLAFADKAREAIQWPQRVQAPLEQSAEGEADAVAGNGSGPRPKQDFGNRYGNLARQHRHGEQNSDAGDQDACQGKGLDECCEE